MTATVANPTPQVSPVDVPLAPAPRRLTLAELVAKSLEQQQQLSAVERFSQWHETVDATPLQAKHYQALLPTAPPQDGEQYAFDVDLDACSGCKSCVAACHALNGLDENESWRDVGMLIAKDADAPAALQYVTTACHHCLEPACAAACPVNAYEKDEVTGIVRHLDDQCFGCQYCTLACPYEVPKFHAGKGIVRKCDMCAGRLRDGEAPACVQSCPNEAIRITVVKTSDVAAREKQGPLVPGAVTSDFTMPTTTFRSKRRDLSRLAPADASQVRPQHAHAALVAMLVLTQLSVGTLTAAALAMLTSPASQPAGGATFFKLTAGVAAATALLGIAASTCHLGRPQFALRALLGLSHSWLSREILAFGVFLPIALTTAAAAWLSDRFAIAENLLPALLATCAITGAIAVYCSMRIYQFTRRPFWAGAHTAVKFALTAVILGAAISWWAATAAGDFGRANKMFASILLVATVAKLAFEVPQLTASDEASAPWALSAKLLRDDLCPFTTVRIALAVVGGIALPAAHLTGDAAPSTAMAAATLACIFCLMGELCERTLFFKAVVPLKMPGGLPA